MKKQYPRAKIYQEHKLTTILTTIALSIVLVAAFTFLYTYESTYKPPPFEPEAVSGIPSPPENLRFNEIDKAGIFTIGIAERVVRQPDGSVKLWFTNQQDNEAYLLCEIIDTESGITLYRSGLLRPGEYVETLHPLKSFENVPKRIEISIYALGLEDYMSLGQLVIENILY